MGWKRIALGAAVGLAFGGPIGSIFGAAVAYEFDKRASNRRRSSRRSFRSASFASPMAQAYAALGASPSDSAEVLKRRYRALAKKLHPDLLRAQGVSGDALKRATDRMVRINVAWKTVRENRGIK